MHYTDTKQEPTENKLDASKYPMLRCFLSEVLKVEKKSGEFAVHKMAFELSIFIRKWKFSELLLLLCSRVSPLHSAQLFKYLIILTLRNTYWISELPQLKDH